MPINPGDRLQLDLAFREALRERHWDRGLDLALHLCDEEPDEPGGWFWQATFLWRLGRVAEAGVAARRAVLLAPEDAEARRLAAELTRLPAVPGPPAASPEALLPTLVDATPTPPPTRDTVATSLTFSPGKVIAGRWEVRGSARGGMGEVLFVFDRELGRMHAVKTPLPDQLASEEGRARFVREAEAWVGLGLHPNVCAAYFVHELGGVPRLFIEYVDGSTLDDWLRAHRDATLGARLDLAIQLAAGMQHAHTFAWEDEAGGEHRGIVHRDLKPSNVLVGHDGGVRITDFGLVGRPGLTTMTAPPATPTALHRLGTTAATGTWGTLTMGDTLMGTPPYMPPEQWDGAHLVGPAGDIYAAGCIFYEMFCGRRPFVLEGAAALASPEVRLAQWERLHRSVPPPDPLDLAPGLDTELAALMRRCLDKQPERRPGSFAELRVTLAAIYVRVAGHPYPRREPEATALLADTLNNQGVSFVTLGQPRRAEAAWRRALAAQPHHVEASYNLALLRWRGGGTDAEARSALAEVRRSHSATWRDEHLAGRLDLCLGEGEEARSCLLAAAEETSEWEVARDAALAVAAGLSSDDPSSWREVLAHLEPHAERLASDALAAGLQVLALTRLGEHAAARRAWEAATAAGLQVPDVPDELMARTVPGACLRRRVVGITTRVAAASVSPDGRVAALVTEDGRVCTVDPTTGEVLRTLRPPGERPRCLALHPDGQTLFVAGGAERVGVWSLQRGERERTLHLQPGVLGALAVTPDGQWVAGLGSEGSLTVWEAASGTRVGSWRAHAGYGTCLAAPSAHRVLSGGADGVVRVWEVQSAREVASLDARSGEPVTALAATVDLGRVLVASADRRLRVWEGGQVVGELGGHAERSTFVALSPTSGHALSASLDGSLRIWDLARGEPLAAVRVGGPVMAGSCTSDLSTVVLGHGGGALVLDCQYPPSFRPGWALGQPLTVDATLERLSTFRFTLARAEERVGAGEWQGALEMLGVARAVEGFSRAPEALGVLARIQAHLPHRTLRDAWEERRTAAHGERVTALALSGDGRLAASAGADGRLALWRLGDGAPVWAAQETGSFETALAFVPGGRLLVTGGVAHAVRTWDTSSGRSISAWSGHGGQITQVATGAGGGLALSLSVDHTARVWELGTGTCLRTVTHHRGPVLAGALDPGERFAVTADDTGVVLVWELERGSLLGRLSGPAAAVTALAISPDGSQVLTGDRDGLLRLHDLHSGRCLRTLETGAGEAVTAVTFAPDGRFAASGGRDGALRVWDLRARACLLALGGHTGAVNGVAFTPGGQRLLSAGADGTLRAWFCEWEPEPRAGADWDERALPYLELFLHRHPGRWGEADLQALLGELEERGLGWLRPEGVRRKLVELGAMWRGLPAPQPLPEAPAPTGRLAVAAAPGGLPRWLTWGGAGLAVALVLGAVGVWRSVTGLRLDPQQVEQVRLRVQIGQLVHQRPDALSCDRALLSSYVLAYGQPYSVDPQTAETAAACLEKLADPSSVAPLLGQVRDATGDEEPDETPDGEVTWRGQRVAALLARMGDRVVDEVSRGLGDPNADVSGTAALALAVRGSERSISSLAGSAFDPDPRVRHAVARVLPELVASQVLPAARAFGLVERLAGDAAPATRQQAAEAIRLFGGRAAHRLAERLTHDPDPRVSAAAAAVLKQT